MERPYSPLVWFGSGLWNDPNSDDLSEWHYSKSTKPSNYHINSWVEQLSIQVIWCDIACYSDRVCFLYSNIVCDCQLEAPEWFIWDGCMKSKRNKATTYRLQSCLVSLQNGSFFPLYMADVHQVFYMRRVIRLPFFSKGTLYTGHFPFFALFLPFIHLKTLFFDKIW